MTRLGVVGSRGYAASSRIFDLINGLAASTVVVSGGAQGVDTMAVNAARARGLDVEVLPADWKRHGRRAGPLRNTELVARVEFLVAFWDGASRGTADTIRKAREAGKLWAVYGPRGELLEGREAIRRRGPAKG